MKFNVKCMKLIGIVLACVPGSLMADTVYIYTGNPPTSFNLSFTTSLTGAGVDNLAAGTDILPSLVTSTFSYAVPPTDESGFPLGGGVGSGYLSYTLAALHIGTDGLGQISSWDFTEHVFASYPASPNENPNDFFCTYDAVSNSGSNDSTTLTQDADAGLCFSGSSATLGTWNAQATGVPEPASFFTLGAGLVGLAALVIRRGR